jgi:hypothetical protein
MTLMHTKIILVITYPKGHYTNGKSEVREVEDDVRGCVGGVEFGVHLGLTTHLWDHINGISGGS